jgi:hypothetical protein
MVPASHDAEAESSSESCRRGLWDEAETGNRETW